MGGDRQPWIYRDQDRMIAGRRGGYALRNRPRWHPSKLGVAKLPNAVIPEWASATYRIQGGSGN
jgi:hypothetical protein